jgi:prophage regulatory protein
MASHDDDKHVAPEIGLMRLKQVLQLIPVSRSTFWAGVKSQRFPQPIKLGPRITAWRKSDIVDFIAAAGDDAKPANHVGERPSTPGKHRDR